MTECVLSIDVGTSSNVAMVVSPKGEILGRSRTTNTLRHPAPGLVEQDPEELWSQVLTAIRGAIEGAGLPPEAILAVGITGQRSSTILWDRATNRTMGPLISWQDKRGEKRAMELLSQGFLVNSICAASKLEWAIANLPGALRLMEGDRLAWGNVDSFIAWRLSNGEVHATDPSQGCTTGYYDIQSGGWNERLVEVQGLNPKIFPIMLDTCTHFGTTHKEILGAEVPITAIVGDQQSAAYAQGCLREGQAKVTFGTSATCNLNTGHSIRFGARGCYPLILWRRKGETAYCVEGMVITAGAVLEWLTHGLGVLKDPSEAQSVASSVSDSHGVHFLPALEGLGSPHADPSRRARFEGLSSGVQAAHLVRAAMEGVAFRVREMIQVLHEGSGYGMPEIVRVDGGASSCDLLMQIQADVLGRPVERMEPVEATAFGAAVLAGWTIGLWTDDDSVRLRRVSSVFHPVWDEQLREENFHRWRRRCGLEEG
jgi:glycerol kinase